MNALQEGAQRVSPACASRYADGARAVQSSATFEEAVERAVEGASDSTLYGCLR